MEKMNNMEYVFFEIDEILNNMPLMPNEISFKLNLFILLLDSLKKEYNFSWR